MAKAKKLPSGSWRINLYIGKDSNGKRKFKSFTHPDKKTCEYLASEYQINHSRKKGSVTDLTLSEAIDRYIETKSNVLSPATVKGYRTCQKNYLRQIMNIKICDLTQENIQRAVNDDAKRYSPKTIRNAHGVLSAILAIYSPDFNLHTTLPQKVKPTIYVPSNNDIKQILKLAEGTALELPIMLAAFGSMRRSEICVLSHEDVHGNTIIVNKAVVRGDDNKYHLKTTKTEASTRSIELPDFIIETIQKTSPPLIKMTPHQLTQAFRRMLLKNGIKPFRFHDLRHYQASILHAIGIPDKYIIQRGGWKTDNTLKNIYQHTMDETTKKTNDQANDYFSNLMEKNSH